nr:hypothetical protein [Pseudoclavibacter sp. Marseille-Q3772]
MQTRLDEAIGQYAEGKLRLDTLTKLESNLKAQIAGAEREMMPPITDERIRQLAGKSGERERPDEVIEVRHGRTL